MKSRFGDKQRLQHILNACEKIDLATKGYDNESFLKDFIVSAAVCNFIMIIGEASVALTKEFKNKYISFDWNLMKGMRNIIVHEYFGVDEQKVWETVVNDIPKLITDCKMALKDFE